MINNILIEILGTIAEEERNKIRARQTEGAELPKDFEKLYKQCEEENINATQYTKLLGLKSRTTLYKYIERYETK